MKLKLSALLWVLLIQRYFRTIYSLRDRTNISQVTQATDSAQKKGGHLSIPVMRECACTQAQSKKTKDDMRRSKHKSKVLNDKTKSIPLKPSAMLDNAAVCTTLTVVQPYKKIDCWKGKNTRIPAADPQVPTPGRNVIIFESTSVCTFPNRFTYISSTKGQKRNESRFVFLKLHLLLFVLPLSKHCICHIHFIFVAAPKATKRVQCNFACPDKAHTFCCCCCRCCCRCCYFRRQQQRNI